MIALHNLGKYYNSANGSVHALDGITLTVKKREFVSLIGPSGCGKSTLIKIIGDIIEPTTGSVAIQGISARDARLRGMFSYVFQNPVLLPWRRVVDNLRLPLEILHRKARDPSRLLELVGLAGCETLYPRELSGGMQQRVALARALIFDPEILMLDEPFGAVDELTRNTLNEELLRIWQETGVTVLLVTHSIAEAIYMADRVVLLSKRPGTIKRIEEVPFLRPREEAIKESQAFQELVKCLREELN